MSTKNAFTWQDPPKTDFILTKKLLTSPLVVKPFNTKAQTILLMDASRLHRLGFALMQKPDNSDKLSLVMCGSKSLTETQANYATVELETPAILYACQKFDFYHNSRYKQTTNPWKGSSRARCTELNSKVLLLSRDETFRRTCPNLEAVSIFIVLLHVSESKT